ncbi:hypothetical protein T310_1542 [Rasamsonia emersonii CBS 393.64]|uniref:Uncharacterized protein n=1 Tax=Rasamsonia emersonii (strain ATCC 16479 / CBS 393.64 / IMI 116815) TaxID=1408163 RepID=A0A0F4Z2V1_RASE3|nr:hypothetical protein T310_1542 [Rasamsonia emersonii CBS 393.64]KKA24421.1 hypothetical protein T310_1542 [Rasamsonia emersonii CBS 393.64]
MLTNNVPSGRPNTPSCGQSSRDIHELTALGERFLRLAAEALSLPPETFFSFLPEQHRLKLAHYPAASSSSAPARTEQGVGPHKTRPAGGRFCCRRRRPTSKACRPSTATVSGSTCPISPGVRGSLTKAEAVGSLKEYFATLLNDQALRRSDPTTPTSNTTSSAAEEEIDSPFLRGKYDTWGES